MLSKYVKEGRVGCVNGLTEGAVIGDSCWVKGLEGGGVWVGVGAHGDLLSPLSRVAHILNYFMCFNDLQE